MSVGRTVYNALFRRTSTFAVTIVIGAFAFERVFDEGMDNLWENMNRGVSCTVPKFSKIQSKTVSVAVIPYSSMVNCPNLGTLTQGLHCGVQQAAKLFNLNAFKRKTFPVDGQTRGRFLKGGITLLQGKICLISGITLSPG